MTLDILDDYVKIKLFAYLELEDFNSITKTSKEIYNLCNNTFHSESLYQMRSEYEFSEVLYIKDPKMKWKEFYQRIISHLKIIDKLNKLNKFLKFIGYFDSLFQNKKYLELKYLFIRQYLAKNTDNTWLIELIIKYAFTHGNLEFIQFCFLLINDNDNYKYFSSRGFLIDEERVLDDNRHLHVFKWLASLSPPMLPDSNTANTIAENGSIDILNWMSKLNPPVLPTYDVIEELIIHGNRLGSLQWLSKLNPPMLPYPESLNDAAEFGNLKVCKWLITLPQVLPPTQETANLACKFSHIRTLKWLASLPNPVFPDKNGALEAVIHGSDNVVAVLKWMSTLTPPISIDQEIYDTAFRNSNMTFNVLKWMATLSPPFLPNEEHLKEILRTEDEYKNKFELFKLVIKLNPSLLKAKFLPGYAIFYNHTHIVSYLSELSEPVLPTHKDVAWAMLRIITQSMYDLLDKIMPEGIKVCINKFLIIEKHRFYLQYSYPYDGRCERGYEDDYNLEKFDLDTCDCVDMCEESCPCRGDIKNNSDIDYSNFILSENKGENEGENEGEDENNI